MKKDCDTDVCACHAVPHNKGVAVQLITGIKKRMAHRKNNPVHLLSAMMGGLRHLKLDLAHAGSMTDRLSAIVFFFDVVSKWDDRGLTDVIEAFDAANYNGRHNEAISKLQILSLHFRQAGRGEMNRTKRGERATDENVYLGDIFGLFTKTVAYWKTTADDEINEWRGTVWEPYCRGINCHDVVSRQARNLMTSHIGPMIKLIDELDRMTC